MDATRDLLKQGNLEKYVFQQGSPCFCFGKTITVFTYRKSISPKNSIRKECAKLVNNTLKHTQ